MLHMEVYPALPTEAASIRKEVFMEEQGFVEEFDEIDHQARHIVVFNGEVPIGTCRFYWDQERNSYVLGRVAVRKARIYSNRTGVSGRILPAYMDV